MDSGTLTIEYHIDGQSETLDDSIKESFKRMGFEFEHSGFDLRTRVRDITFKYEGDPQEKRSSDA